MSTSDRLLDVVYDDDDDDDDDVWVLSFFYLFTSFLFIYDAVDTS